MQTCHTSGFNKIDLPHPPQIYIYLVSILPPYTRLVWLNTGNSGARFEDSNTSLTCTLIEIPSFLRPQEQLEKTKPSPAAPSPAPQNEEAEEPDETASTPPVVQSKGRRRRGAFSAEPLTEEYAASYVKKVKRSLVNDDNVIIKLPYTAG